MPSRPSATPLQWSSAELPPPGNYQQFRRAVASSPGCAILESAMPHPRWGRYSIFAFDPVRVCRIGPGDLGDPFAQLAACCRPRLGLSPPCELPFVGGWVGYLAYEAGRFAEPAGWPAGRSKTADGLARQPVPLSRWQFFDTVLIHDALQDSWIAAGVELPPCFADRPRPPLGHRLARLARRLSGGGCESVDLPCVQPAPLPGDLLSVRNTEGARWDYSREAYLAKVERTLEYIRAGDIFQANVARRCRLPMNRHPFEVYERLQDVNPSTFAAYLPLPPRRLGARSAAIVSASPELFLSVRSGTVTTRPIKGTRPRGATLEDDGHARRALAASSKDRAELNMIIDLERNDLGRVCEYGTVQVESEGDMETLPTVFHRTATITGRLRETADAIDLLRGTFPGGSITGAPKVRAMQIIHELEPGPRGPYCGAIGYIGINGDMMLNLAIRTMLIGNGFADVMVGSGIVADSVPEEEYAELEAKAAGMMAALGTEADRPALPNEVKQTAYP